MPIASTSIPSWSTAPAAGGEKPDRGSDHRHERQTHPDDDRLERDPARATGDEDGVGEGVDPVDGQHDVGGLRRRRRAPGGEGDPDPGGREGGGVVDAVADHDGAGRGPTRRGWRPACRWGRGRRARRRRRRCGRRSRRCRPGRRSQDRAPDPDLAQGRHHARRVGPHRVLEEEGAGGVAVDGDEHREAPVERRPAAHLAQPRRVVVADDPPRLAEPDPSCPPTTPRGRSRAPRGRPSGARGRDRATAGRADEGARERVGRHLVERGREAQDVGVGRGAGGDDDGVSSGRPWVRVPVLSKSTTSPAARVSRAAPPLTTTPIREARDRPDMIATGAASSSGHGVATTSTATARSGEPATAHAAPASASVSGTKSTAKRSAVRTKGADVAWACSTSRTTFA